ncbi:hypothetical protein [Rhodalgimonas zhirmunskyi]|uniref:Uncharacterized protein n=1 Tax=Rhodalgimonas zhirmunskyi TaxID=2964767 RepID=A0AAJ1UAY8_9RHOB|nr:hypothetical protein [Rhodoalgimonas zhirmunskyi]MDQ2094498.1 hypothetical protein [Rhodoalgimonas zhirmunskyi]
MAYPWQKQKDREHKLAEERRTAYRRYIEFVLYARDEITAASIGLKAQVDTVDLSVVREAINEYSRRLGHETAFMNLIADDEIAKKANELNTVLDAVLSDAKNEISHQEQYSGSQLRSIMLKTLEVLRERLDLQLSELLFLMRGREFLNSSRTPAESRDPLALANKVTPR